nr:hypothetical protein [Tanacetum cinerariifolium]
MVVEVVGEMWEGWRSSKDVGRECCKFGGRS